MVRWTNNKTVDVSGGFIPLFHCVCVCVSV